MIPKIVPPLSGSTILVTRPTAQAESLCLQIQRYGGTPIRFPTITIEPITAAVADVCDLAVFVSANAVQYGAHLLAPNASMRVAAIGKATAAALREAKVQVDYVPESGFTSEALLAHPDLKLEPGMRALIMRGEGGRELLQQSFERAGLSVQTREVYRRVLPQIDIARRDAIEAGWAEEGVDIVILTSVTTLQHLLELLSDRGRALLKNANLLVISDRIGEAASAAGLRGEIIIAAGADDDSILGGLARWRMRARE
jgi:uroporphyrinogen-III synthase